MITILGDGTLADAIAMNVETNIPEEVIWVAYDVPDDRDKVIDHIFDDLSAFPPSIVILSTQLILGCCAMFEARFPQHRFAVYPENLRVATAERDFRNQDRAVIGTRHLDLHPFFINLFHPYTKRIIFMSPESAEMTKHATNGFLAMSIQYANRINDLCHLHGADYTDVQQALLADKRIGPHAYLTPGDIGSHLQRELNNLDAL